MSKRGGQNKKRKLNMILAKLTAKLLLVVCAILLPSQIFAMDQYTKINGVVYYSQYHPNYSSKFKGTIIFQSGGMNTTKEWTENKVFFNCAKTLGPLFLYDRSGLGKSTPDLSTSMQNPITAKLVNDNLVKLLKARHIKPPYILVAHSYGGLYMGYFSRKYPNLVKGVLMVDAPPVSFHWSKKILKEVDFKKYAKIPSKLMYKRFSYKNSIKNKTTPASTFYQMVGFKETERQIRSLPPLPNDIPIIILSSSYMEKHKLLTVDWYKGQKEWLNRNPHSVIIKVKSGHFIQQERPKLVCKKIQELANHN
jgi:pimeloyl-ACP methyl ester carboxylesterase